MLSDTPPLERSPDPTTAQLEAALAESVRLIAGIRELRRRVADPDADLTAEMANVRRAFEAVVVALGHAP